MDTATENKSPQNNQSFITMIGGIILALIAIIAGVAGVFLNSSKSQNCSGKDPISGETLNGYKDSTSNICKTIDGKELK